MKKNKKLGEKIVCYRKKLGLSQFDLANICEISQASVARFESGLQKNPTAKTIEKLARGLQVSSAVLLDESVGIGEGWDGYSKNTVMLPVVSAQQLRSERDLRKILPLIRKSGEVRVSLSGVPGAFFLRVGTEFAAPPFIGDGDILFLTPYTSIADNTLVFLVTPGALSVGTIYDHDNAVIIRPPGAGDPLVRIQKRNRKISGALIFRIGEIIKGGDEQK